MIFIKFEETVCVGTVNNRLDFQAFCSNLTSGLSRQNLDGVNHTVYSEGGSKS